MSRASIVALVWAAGLLGPAVVLWAIFTPSDATSFILPAAATVGTVLIAVLARAARPRDPEPERVLPLSLPTAAFTTGIAVVLIGFAVAPWLWGIGAGIAVLGLAGLIREWWAR